MATIGTCSLCGGRVEVESPWYGINPPTPKCSTCGARKKNPHGPVIEMEPDRTVTIVTGTKDAREEG